MSEKFDGNFENYYIDMDKIINSAEFSAVTRLLAVELKKNPYKTVGEFFEKISDSDLNVLLMKIDEEDLEEILLLTELLARAEGAGANDIEQVTRNVNVMTMLIAGESLSRRGITKSFYENMSFGEDYNDHVVFRRVGQ